MLMLRAVTILVLCLVSICGVGCAAADSPSRGWDLTLRVSQPEGNKLVYYNLARDGRLVYVAGLQAGRTEIDHARPTWAGNFSGEELAELITLVEANQEPSTVKPEAGAVNYKVVMTRGGNLFARRYVSGPTAFFSEMERQFKRLQQSRRGGELDFDPRSGAGRP